MKEKIEKIPMHRLWMVPKDAGAQFLHINLRETVLKRFVLVLESSWKFPGNLPKNARTYLTLFFDEFNRLKKNQLKNRMQQML